MGQCVGAGRRGPTLTQHVSPSPGLPARLAAESGLRAQGQLESWRVSGPRGRSLYQARLRGCRAAGSQPSGGQGTGDRGQGSSSCCWCEASLSFFPSLSLTEPPGSPPGSLSLAPGTHTPLLGWRGVGLGHLTQSVCSVLRKCSECRRGQPQHARTQNHISASHCSISEYRSDWCGLSCCKMFTFVASVSVTFLRLIQC